MARPIGLAGLRHSISEAAARTHLWGLVRARAVMKAGVHRRDRRLPDLAELRNFTIPGADEPLSARLYVPMSAEANGPLLVFFHGGGFVVGDLDTHDSLCWRLAHVAGVRVLSCLYRLAPEHPFPSQFDDALAATRWALAHAGDLGARSDSVSIGGDSAGGYLAIATAKALNDEQPGTIRAQVLLYPLMHLDDDAWKQDGRRTTRPIGRLAVRYIGAQLATMAPSLLASSAIAPLPSLIASGGPLDPCRADAAAYAERLRDLGATVIWREYAPLVHGFGNLAHTLPAARAALHEIGELTGEIMRKAGPQ